MLMIMINAFRFDDDIIGDPFVEVAKDLGKRASDARGGLGVQRHHVIGIGHRCITTGIVVPLQCQDAHPSSTTITITN